MSASAVGIGGRGAVRFWYTTNGKKVAMAVSGVVLAGFVAGHLLGNLQVFLGPDQFNAYAKSLRDLPALVWGVQAVLLTMVTLHIWSSIQLAVAKKRARPIGFERERHAASTYASRTMYWSGPILAAFIVYHLMQFTFGTGGTPYSSFDAYGNVIAGFRVPAVSTFYILAMGLLCLHLRHGLWSILQTLGFEQAMRFRRVATLLAVVIFFGFVSIPVAVLARVIPRYL